MTDEKFTKGQVNHTVLVAVDRLTELSEAFPNLYADTGVFLREIGGFLNEPYSQ
jgi:hypothetical protein